MTDLFNDDGSNIEPAATDNVLEQLVGDGKKYKDAEALAKSRIAADNHIAKLEREQAELRKEMENRLSLEEFLDQQKQLVARGTDDNHQEERTENVEGLTKEQVADLVRSAITKEKTEATQNENFEYVRSELTKVYGDNFADKISRRATQLRMSKEVLNAMALNHPHAFLELMKPQGTQQVDNVTPPNSSVRVPTGPTGKGKSYYDNLRKTDFRKWMSPEIQNEMDKASQRMGAAFFDN